MDLLKLCKDLIAINSVSVPQGTSEIGPFVAKMLKELGCEIKTQQLEIEGHANINLLASMGPKKSKAPLLINTHLDTVSPGPHPEKTWTLCEGNPFRATESAEGQEHFLHGLGAADTKLAMACVIVALDKVLKKNPDKKPQDWRETLHIMGTAGEEKGLLGAKFALESKFVQAKYAIDSEPSELNLVWAHKGINITQMRIIPQISKESEFSQQEKFIALHFLGEAAHSSTPLQGKNALEQAIQFLTLFFEGTHKIGHHSLTPCLLEGGTTANVIPERATIYFRGLFSPKEFVKSLGEISHKIVIEECTIDQEKHSFLLPKEVFQALVEFKRELKVLSEKLMNMEHPEYSPSTDTTATTWIYPNRDPQSDFIPHLVFFQDHRFIQKGDGKKFFHQMEKLGKKINHKFPNLKITLEIERTNDPMTGNKNSPFIHDLQSILKALQLPGDLQTKSGCTEGALFAAEGMETVVFGPGQALNNIHKPNERVPIPHLFKAVEFYEKVIEKYCL